MADVATQHVPDQVADVSEGSLTLAEALGEGIRWAPPDRDVLDRVLIGLQRL